MLFTTGVTKQLRCHP